MTHIQMCGYFIHCYAAIFLHDGFNCCNGLRCHYSVCLTGSRRVCYRTNAVYELPSPLAVVTDMHHHTELSFIGECRWVSPLHYLKTDDRTLFFFGACCNRGRHLYTTTAPSCCIPASYCHLSATLQTMSIVVVTLPDNRAFFFIALLKFSFDPPS